MANFFTFPTSVWACYERWWRICDPPQKKTNNTWWPSGHVLVHVCGHRHGTYAFWLIKHKVVKPWKYLYERFETYIWAPTTFPAIQRTCVALVGSSILYCQIVPHCAQDLTSQHSKRTHVFNWHVYQHHSVEFQTQTLLRLAWKR